MSLPEPYHGKVLPEWIDHNGHMNLAYYVLAFDLATDKFFELMGIDQHYRDTTGCSTFAGNIHVYYKQELHEGEAFTVTSTLLGYDEKRIRFMHQMFKANDSETEGGVAGDDAEVALIESLSLHVDLTQRRVCPMPELLTSGLARIQAAQGAFEVPPEIGQTIQKPPVYAGD